MARVRIEPGGKVIIAVIVVAAALFLFFEFKPPAPRKPAETVSAQTQSTTPSSQVPEAEEKPKTASQTPGQTTANTGATQNSAGEAGSASPIRVYFAFNRAGINKNVYCIFDRIQSIVNREGMKGMRIVVEGNSDSIGPSWYNVELSKRRAMRVADSLSNRLGIPLNSISVLANGSSRPIASNSTSAGRADNRRTDIIIYP